VGKIVGLAWGMQHLVQYTAVNITGSKKKTDVVFIQIGKCRSNF